MTTFAQSSAAVNSASVKLCDTVYSDDVLYTIGTPTSMITISVIDVCVFMSLV